MSATLFKFTAPLSTRPDGPDARLLGDHERYQRERDAAHTRGNATRQRRVIDERAPPTPPAGRSRAPPCSAGTAASTDATSETPPELSAPAIPSQALSRLTSRVDSIAAATATALRAR